MRARKVIVVHEEEILASRVRGCGVPGRARMTWFGSPDDRPSPLRELGCEHGEVIACLGGIAAIVNEHNFEVLVGLDS